MRIPLTSSALLWLFAFSIQCSSHPLLLNLKPGEWRELPNTQMISVFPSPEQTTWGVVGPSAVVIAWGGAAFDTKRNAFVFNGGGHADYGGNEVYAFFLEEMKWHRLTKPSRMRKLDSGQYVTVDETPISAHTYDGLEYLPNVDRIFRNGGSEWLTGRNYDRSAWLFDMNNRQWERKSQGGGGYPVSAFDPVRGSVYVVGQIYVDEYRPDKDVWIRHLAGEAEFLPKVGAIDPNNRTIVTDSYHPGVLAYHIRPNGSVSGRNFVRTEGATEWDKIMGALEYDPVRRVLVAWAGGRETAYLDLKSKRWVRLQNTVSQRAPIKDRKHDYSASGAIYGRWRYVPKYDLFIGYNAPDRNVWIWKPATLEQGDDTPPSPPVVRPLLENLKDGGTAVIPPGSYREGATIRARDVTIKAHGVRLEGTAVEGKAALVVQGDGVTIEGIECAGINVPDGNGACVRLEASDLSLIRVHFRDSQSGLMSWNRNSGTVRIENSRFERLGRAHGVYIGRGDTHLIIRGSKFLSSTDEGHEIKSRAARNTIEGNVIASLSGIDSRLIDLPEGGVNIIRSNVLQEGPKSANQDLIGIGLEGQIHLHSQSHTVIEDNLILLDRGRNTVLVNYRLVPSPSVNHNILVGGQPNRETTNTWHSNRNAAGIPPYPHLPTTAK